MSGYLTTNENGEFTGTVTGLTAGQKIITATFEGDDEYNRSTINKHITILDPTIELSLTSPTEIIQIGDTTTITATLTRNSLPFVNKEITYEIKHGSTLINRDSDFTNNAGQITISYTGTGVGDITITASFVSLQETYMIEDLFYYDSLTVDKSRYTVISGNPSLSYGSNGLTVNSNVSQVGLVRNNALVLPSDYEAEITITNAPAGQYCGGICFDDWLYDAGSANVAYTYKLSNTSTLSTNIQKITTGDVFKVVKQGTSMKLYLNGTLIVTNTISDDTHYQHFRTYLNRPTTFKDLKIKAL